MFNIKDLKTLKAPILTCDHLDFKTSDIIKLEGKSGSGKSTFLKALAGLKSVSIFETNLDFNQIIYLSQTPISSSLKVADFIEKIQNFKKNKDYVIKSKLLEFLNETFLLNQSINSLSGGQKQLVSLSIALDLNPAVILLDESFTGIDQEKEQKIIDYIKRNFFDLIIFYVSHKESILDKYMTKKIKIDFTKIVPA